MRKGFGMSLMGRAVAFGLLAALAACNTVQGFGRDLQSGGTAISDTAEDTQSQL